MAHLKRKRESTTKNSKDNERFLTLKEEKTIEKNTINNKNSENSKCILLETILRDDNVDRWTEFLVSKMYNIHWIQIETK